MIMKVILFMAMTPNGMIAKSDGSEDFLSDRNWKEFRRLAESAGCFVVGRKTYEIVHSTYKDYNFDDVKAERIVVSGDEKFLPAPGFTKASSPKDAVRKAAAKGRKKLLLTGGSRLNSSFMHEGFVDEMIFNIEPAVIGKGINVFAEKDFYRRLALKKIRKIPKGLVQIHYKIMEGKK